MKNIKRVVMFMLVVFLSSSLTACVNEGDTAMSNMRTEAANFGVNRRIVFYNGINGDYILSIEGLCTMDSSNRENVHVICKTGPGKYKYHSMVAGDNMGVFVEQIDDAQVSAYHYKVVFRPQLILPEVEIRSGK